MIKHNERRQVVVECIDDMYILQGLDWDDMNGSKSRFLIADGYYVLWRLLSYRPEEGGRTLCICLGREDLGRVT